METDEQARPDSEPKLNPYDRVLAGIAAAVTLLLAVHVVVNAISRTFFNNPVQGTLEYTQFWYIPIIAFIGIATAQRSGEHISADLFFTGLPQAAKPVLVFIIDVVTALLVLALAYYTLQMALESTETRRTAGVTGIEMWQATFIAPIGFVLYVGAIVAKNVVSIRDWRATRAAGGATEGI